MKETEKKAIHSYLKSIGSRGGKTRAAKYDKKTLSKWAQLGGRPRKDGKKRSPNAK